MRVAHVDRHVGLDQLISCPLGRQHPQSGPPAGLHLQLTGSTNQRLSTAERAGTRSPTRAVRIPLIGDAIARNSCTLDCMCHNLHHEDELALRIGRVGLDARLGI